MVPEARVAVAHGQMDEGSLETVVLDFWERRYDVLVCTTIIESGIDMPSVNTLIVDRADLLGLGQLHQIRGRVGRSGQRAYAYLFHPVDRVLSEQSYERLRTIGEHTELGSGFKIAMRDLEIRGAGNLLGSDQSGHIAAVGYDLYVQLVAEAVAEARGEPRPTPSTVSIDVPGDAHLPKDYVAAEDARLEAYRRLASATSLADVDDIGAEWVDRYGPLPVAADGLLALARLRATCWRAASARWSMSSVRGLGRAAAHGAGLPGGAAGQRSGAPPTPGPGGHLPRGPGPAAPSDLQRGCSARHGAGRHRRASPAGRCGLRRGHLVECAAHEEVPRPPCRPGRWSRLGGVLGAIERGRRQRERHHPAGPRIPTSAPSPTARTTSATSTPRSTCRRRGASSRRPSSVPARARTPGTTRPPRPPSWPATSRPTSATSSCSSWPTSAMST